VNEKIKKTITHIVGGALLFHSNVVTYTPKRDVLTEDCLFSAWGKLHAQVAHHSGALVAHKESVLFE
jgi:hypothetical protein